METHIMKKPSGIFLFVHKESKEIAASYSYDPKIGTQTQLQNADDFISEYAAGNTVLMEIGYIYGKGCEKLWNAHWK